MVGHPSTVCTTTDADFLAYMTANRASFYAAGRYWVIYRDSDGDIWYRSSTDGVSWSDAGSYIGNGIGTFKFFDIHFDGTYVQLVASGGVNGTTLYYERGAPQSNGTINLDAADEVQAFGAGEHAENVSITLNSEGYPIIMWSRWEGAAQKFPWVSVSTTKDGTWTTKAGYPKQLESTANYEGFGISTVLPLSNNNLLCLWGLSTKGVAARPVTNDTVGSRETPTTTNELEDYYCWSALVLEDGVVHLTYEDSANIIQYKYRTTGGSWEGKTALASSQPNQVKPHISPVGINDLLVIWLNITDDKIYLRKRINGTWIAAHMLSDESTDQITNGRRITSWRKPWSEKIGILYLTKTGSPYNIRFNWTEAGYVHVQIQHTRK